jgi:RimJ/RimL family protein N-acetyltransferase
MGGLTITRNDDGTSTLAGQVADQSQLHGILVAIRDIGTPLLRLRAVGSDRTAGDVVQPALGHRIRTDRLVLRSATADDAVSTWEFRRLDAVNQWLTGCPADFEAYKSLFADPARLAATVVVALPGETGETVIGDLMLRRDDAWAQLDVVDQAKGAQAELGWVLDPAHVGRGYATEAVRELIRYTFEELGVRRVVANCFLANEESWRLMERVGMRREGHAVRESLHRSGRWLDTVTYALLADESTALEPTAIETSPPL